MHLRSRLRQSTKRQLSFDSPKKTQAKKAKVDHDSIFNLRSSARTTVIDDKGQKVPLKTSILVNKEKLNLTDPTKLPHVAELLHDKCQNIPTHIDVKSIQYDAKGSPAKAIAVDGTTLDVYLKTGLISYLRNKPKTPHKPVKIKSDYKKNPILKYIVSPPKDAKTKTEYKLTPKSHKRRTKKLKKNKYKRPITQQRAMARKEFAANRGRVVPYCKAVLMWSPARGKNGEHPSHNWGHPQAFSLGGPQAGLLGISAHANSLQIPQDNCNGKLLDHYSEVHGTVESTLVEGTHVAIGKLIQITKTKDFAPRFEYEAQEKSLPLQSTKPYVENLFDSLVEAHKNSTNQPLTQTTPAFFYQKNDPKTPKKKKPFKKLNFKTP